MIDIRIEADGEQGARIFFAKDLSVSDALKAEFPRVRFERHGHGPHWYLPGKTAARRAEKWRDAARAARQDAVAAGTTLRARARGTDTTVLRVTGEMEASLVFPYSDEAVALVRTLPRAQYCAGNRWTVHPSDAAGVEAVIGAAAKVASIMRTRREAERKAAAEREAEKASRVQVRVDTAKVGDCVKGQYGRAIVIKSFGESWSDGDSHWHYAYGRPATAEEAASAVAPKPPARVKKAAFAANSVAVGDVVRVDGKAVKVTNLGKRYFADSEEHGSFLPPRLWGRWVEDAVFADADEAEAAALDASEAETAAEKAAARARAAAVARIADSVDAPHVGSVPEGEVVWKQDGSAIYGFERKVVLTPDGWLWHVTYDGSDGALWGDYNLGRNTRGSRLRATPELVAAFGKETS